VKIERDTAIPPSSGARAGHHDTVLETEIIGYTGECSVDRKTNVVDMSLSVAFLVKLGPPPPSARTANAANPSLFHRPADYFPHPAGKQTFTAEIAFPPNVNQFALS
jgi:hypothetical protein